jgi:hypothetical protein
VLKRPADQNPAFRSDSGLYHSVEFSLKGLDFPWQVRIWDNVQGSMTVLVREDSSVLQYLKAGDTVDARYYRTGSIYPSEKVRTLIHNISKNSDGRLRGHYSIDLKIVNS